MVLTGLSNNERCDKPSFKDAYKEPADDEGWEAFDSGGADRCGTKAE